MYVLKNCQKIIVYYSNPKFDITWQKVENYLPLLSYIAYVHEMQIMIWNNTNGFYKRLQIIFKIVLQKKSDDHTQHLI